MNISEYSLSELITMREDAIKSNDDLYFRCVNEEIHKRMALASHRGKAYEQRKKGVNRWRNKRKK